MRVNMFMKKDIVEMMEQDNFDVSNVTEESMKQYFHEKGYELITTGAFTNNEGEYVHTYSTAKIY